MKRYFYNIAKWDEDWFDEMSPDGKLVFIYCWEKSDIAGFIQPTPSRISKNTGIPKEKANRALEEFKDQYVSCGKWVWMKNFLKEQRDHISYKDPYIKSAFKCIKSRSDEFDVSEILNYLSLSHADYQSGLDYVRKAPNEDTSKTLAKTHPKTLARYTDEDEDKDAYKDEDKEAVFNSSSSER